jgi:hypothetical protein
MRLLGCPSVSALDASYIEPFAALTQLAGA